MVFRDVVAVELEAVTELEVAVAVEEVVLELEVAVEEVVLELEVAVVAAAVEVVVIKVVPIACTGVTAAVVAEGTPGEVSSSSFFWGGESGALVTSGPVDESLSLAGSEAFCVKFVCGSCEVELLILFLRLVSFTF